MTVWSWPTLQEIVGFSLVCLSSVFFTVDPLAAIPAFLAMGAGGSEGQDRRGARHAAWTCFWVLGVFASAGSLVFKLFGITLPALKIAGGLLLFLLSLGARVERVLGDTGIRILMRLMGLVLSAMAVQFALNGISDVWPGEAGKHR